MFRSSLPATSRPGHPLAAALSALLIIALTGHRLTAEIEFSTYFGGGAGDEVSAVVVAPDGNVVVVGSTSSADLMGAIGRDGCDGFGNCGQSDVFVLRLTPDGRNVLGGSFVGGSGHDLSSGAAVGLDGSIYVTGSTRSGDFPAVNAHQAELGGGATDPSEEWAPRDAFVVKLTADATRIVYSTYLGGAGDDEAFDIAVDSRGRVMIVGDTDGDFAVTEFGYDFTFNGDTDAFVALLHESGAQVSGFYLGGDRRDIARGVAVDERGFFYVGGSSQGGFPTTVGVYAEESAGGSDAWIAKIDPSKIGLNMLVFSTYLGGSRSDDIYDLALDSDGNIYATGSTTSTNFPITDYAYQSECGCASGTGSDAWVAKLSTDARRLRYSTYLGGGNADVGYEIDVDRLGRAYVTGVGRPGFPTLAVDNGLIDSEADAFLTVVSASGRTLDSSRTLGGNLGGFLIAGPRDYGTSISVDETGNAYASGFTWSSNFPTTRGALLEATPDSGAFGFSNGWVAKQTRTLDSITQALLREILAAPFLEPNDVRLLAREIELAALAVERGDDNGLADALRRFVDEVMSAVDRRILGPNVAQSWFGMADELAQQFEKSRPQLAFSRGDCNDDGVADISDAICMLSVLFSSTPSQPGCRAALNVNGDDGVDISDPITLLSFLFVAGSAEPVAPFPECGPATLEADNAMGCGAQPKSCQF